jgi:c-di-AMP phosphodiesterase-like protein
MERLGGGGHINIAGAQLTDVDIEGAKIKLKEVLTQMTKEGVI